MRVRPLTGQVLIRVLGPIPQSSIIETPDRHVPPEEQQELNHAPTPPPALMGQVLDFGPWRKLSNGLAVVPPFTANAKVIIRNGSGRQLKYGTSDNLRMLHQEDILGVLETQ